MLLPPRAVGLLGPSALVPLYTLLIVGGYFVFHSGAATVSGNEMSRQRALFAAVNAATLTGFQQSTNVNDYTPLGQMLVLGLTLAGILFSFIAGGLAVVRIARMPYSDGRVVAWAFGATMIALILGACALLGDGRGIFAASFQALGAFGNSGLYLGRLPAQDAARTHVVLLPLAVLGGLGLPVLMELFDRVRGRICLSAHSQSVLIWTAGVYMVATALLIFLQWPSTESPAQWRRAIGSASRLAINARSAGFPGDFPSLRTVQWVLIALMILGAAPAGTAGGLKVTTLAVISGGVRDALRRRAVGRAFGVAMVWAVVYLALFGSSLLVLLTSEPQMPADRLLFLAASALGNVGLAHDPVSLSEPGLYAISVMMLVGRVAPVLMLWWVLDTTPEADVAAG